MSVCVVEVWGGKGERRRAEAIGGAGWTLPLHGACVGWERIRFPLTSPLSERQGRRHATAAARARARPSACVSARTDAYACRGFAFLTCVAWHARACGSRVC